jgi:phosphate starvation-inducible PhoH-like protein
MDTDQKFKDKRKPKGAINFNIKLNQEQKDAKEIILHNPITVLKGMAGSGKTLLACQVALDMLFKREIEKIVITRPTVAREEIGFLPGNLKEKLDPWLAPIYSNLYMLYNREKIDKLLDEGTIEVLPFAFMRGRTLVNAFIIVDEAQNVSHTQTEMIISRLGINSKMVICGDTSQIDLKNKKESGMAFFTTLDKQVEGFKVVTLHENHRHPIVPKILEVYKEYQD